MRRQFGLKCIALRVRGFSPASLAGRWLILVEEALDCAEKVAERALRSDLAMLAGQILCLAQLALAMKRKAQIWSGWVGRRWPTRPGPDQALQVNLVNQARAGGGKAGTGEVGVVVRLLQAGKLLLQHKLLALGAELLDAARQNVIFVHLLVQHQRDLVDLIQTIQSGPVS